MQQSNSPEACSSPASPEISRILWNTNVHHRVHNNPAIIPVLSQINKFHLSPAYLYYIYFNITLPSTARSSNKSSSSMIRNRNPLGPPLTPHTHFLRFHTTNFKSRHLIVSWIIYIHFHSAKTMPFISVLMLSHHPLFQLPMGVQVTLPFPVPGTALMATAKAWKTSTSLRTKQY